MKYLILSISLLSLAACASQPAPKPDSEAQTLGDAHRPHPSPPEVAVSGPLGSRANPVRVAGPQGQHDYLFRLRCADGIGPRFERMGSIGRGPYGRILDAYTVQCIGQAPITVIMDMYHCVEETRPIDGFEIIARSLPIKPFLNCPPSSP